MNVFAVLVLFIGYTNSVNTFENYHLYQQHQHQIEIDYRLKQIDCLAQTIYFEARGEPIIGQYAVAQVVMNRVFSHIYPDSVCKVVYQSNQFSWVKEETHKILDGKQWVDALKVAYNVLTNDVPYSKMIPSNVLFYHTKTVHPTWDHSMVRVATIGNHIFYRLKE